MAMIDQVLMQGCEGQGLLRVYG